MNQKRIILRMFQKILPTIFLIAVMVMFSKETVWAEETYYGKELETGACGENVTWTVYDSGADNDENTDTGDLLVFSGSGEMINYQSTSYSPWYSSYRNSLKTVKFQENSQITSIGNYAFLNCENINSVEISSSVTSIGEKAFYSCSKLSSIELPDSVTTIGKEAFAICSKLSSIELSENLTTIGEEAFRNCGKLSSIKLPDSVTTVGKSAFYSCSTLSSIELSKNLTTIGEEAFYSCSTLSSIKLPDSVTIIGKAAFRSCSKLSNIELSKNLTTIGEEAFYSCSTLSSIELPDSVKVIGAEAFHWCGKLSSIKLPNSVTAIENGVFYGCAELTEVVISDSIKTIGAGAFMNCGSLSSIEIPNSVTDIGEKAFAYCTSLTNISISESVQNIGVDAFYKVSNQLNLQIADTNSYLCVENGIIYNKDKTALLYCLNVSGDFVIPDSVTKIQKNAFGNCTELTGITIPDGVTEIEESTFVYCENLKNITWSKNIVSIGSRAFCYCSNLTSIIIPDGVTTIGESAFFCCDKLESVSIPKNVSSIGESAFYGCSNLKNITIPDKVTRIEGYTFHSCTNLSSVKLPKKLKSIGAYAFSGAGLEEIIIPEGITTIENNVFGYCSNLVSVKLPEKLKSIGQFSFNNCTSLEEISFPLGITTIGMSAFLGCDSLRTVTLPEGITSISSCLFWGCENLSSLIISPNVTAIESDALKNCSSLKEIYYPEGKGLEDYFGSTSIPTDALQGSYTINNDNTVSVIIKKLPENTENLILPEQIYGRQISSVSYADDIEGAEIPIQCTKHFPKEEQWQKDANEHWFTGCKFCEEAEEVREEHEFYYGTKPCSCGYVPFIITTQPENKDLVYEEKEELSVFVSPAYEELEITYQWYENGEEIEGATESTYVIDTKRVISEQKYFCKISCGDYSIESDEVTVNIGKAQAMILVKEDVSFIYTKKPVSLEGITKIGEGTICYTVTEGSDVLSVSEDGKVAIKNIGTANISISMAETENYKEAETKNIKITVEKADYPKTTPDTPVVVKNTVKKVSSVTLMEDWQWDSEDEEKTLPAGKELEVTANYIGEDKGCYHTTSQVVTIKRADCVSSEVMYTWEGEKAPTCTSEGKGHKECTLCEDVLESNIIVPVSKHILTKVNKTGAGCTIEGQKQHWKCLDCKKLFSDEQGTNEVTESSLIIKATGHTGGSANCVRKAVCITCQEEYGELDKSKHGETEVRNAKDADCVNKGYTGDIYCKDCGEKTCTGKEISLESHKLVKVDKKEATCTTEGKEEHYSCSTCKKVFGDEQGSNEITESSLIIKATGHTGGSADCTQKALCTICQKEYGELDKNKHGETEAKNFKEADCEKEGYTGDIYCKACGERVSTGKAIEKTEHTWDGGVITKEPTKKENGVKTYTCTVCGKTKTEEIPAKGEVITPEIPGEIITPTVMLTVMPTVTPTVMPTVTPTVTPTVMPTVSEKPTATPTIKAEPVAPKKGTILTDKKTNAKYKIIVSGTKNGTVEYIKSLSTKSTKINVSATVKINGITYKVVSIAKNAFKNHKKLTKVTIGNNVKTIGANAFYGCKKLKTVSIGKNVTRVGEKAFYKCTALAKVTLPAKVKKIGKQSFYGCKKLKYITVKTTKLTKKNVGSKAFTGINKKATVKVPKSKVKAYEKLLKTKGVSKTVKVKK